MQNGLTHELVKHKNVILLLKIVTQGSDQIRLKQGALRNQRVDLLLFDLPADSVDEQGQFDGVEAVDDRVKFGIFVDDLLVNINKVVHLANA